MRSQVPLQEAVRKIFYQPLRAQFLLFLRLTVLIRNVSSFSPLISTLSWSSVSAVSTSRVVLSAMAVCRWVIVWYDWWKVLSESLAGDFLG